MSNTSLLLVGKIAWIKALREESGWGLKECKDISESPETPTYAVDMPGVLAREGTFWNVNDIPLVIERERARIRNTPQGLLNTLANAQAEMRRNSEDDSYDTIDKAIDAFDKAISITLDWMRANGHIVSWPYPTVPTVHYENH